MPDQYGNLTEEERRRLTGYAPPQQIAPILGNQNATGTGYNQATRDAVNARNNSGISTRDIYDQNGQLQSHDERATPTRDNSANAPAFQGAFMDDPFFQRSDVAPAISATNRDTLGGGSFGVRNWLHDHPVGTMAAFIAAAAGGAAAVNGLGGAAGGGAAGGGAGGEVGGGAVGWGGAGTGGFSGAGDFAPGMAVGGGSAGQLAAAGGISGGAGTGIFGSLGGSGLLSQANLGRFQQLSGLLGGGQQQQSAPAMPYIQPVLGNQAKPQQPQAQQQLIGLPTSTQAPYIPSRGYTPHNFYGATVWS